MTTTETVAILRAFNDWRRGDYEPSEQPAPPDPIEIGEAIDAAVEMIDRLEAAEKERDDVAQQLVQSEIGKREISEAHDALQVEVGKLKELEVSRCVKINGYIVDNARLAEEVERLRAKIEQMEKRLRLILEEPENTMSNSKALREMVRQARLALEESK